MGFSSERSATAQLVAQVGLALVCEPGSSGNGVQRTARLTRARMLSFPSLLGRVGPSATLCRSVQRVAVYEAAVTDLMLARRSSIRSRSTSQYLRADSNSLSG